MVKRVDVIKRYIKVVKELRMRRKSWLGMGKVLWRGPRKEREL